MRIECHTIVRFAILLALWPALAHAELPTIDDAFPPTIRVEPAHQDTCGVVIERLRLDTAAAPVSWLVVEVSSKGRCGATELAIDVPAGARVVGMGVSSRGDRSWSAARTVRAARMDYARETGAALLVWESTSADQDHLHVSTPLPARIELAIELPPLAHVILEARDRTLIDLRNVPARMDRASYAHADATTALVAGAPNRDDPVFSSGRFPRAPSWWGGKASIRQTMKRDRARITHCYERIAQWRGEIEGTATMQFFIDSSGAVERVQTASTDLPVSITSCIEDVIRTWQFPGIDPVLVNYPLRFSTPTY